MLHLLDENFSRIGSFNTYDEVVSFIHNSQSYSFVNLNNRGYPLEGTLGLKETEWRFVYYKHSELIIIYSCMKEPPIKGVECQAFEQGLDLIEIHYGTSLNPIQLPVTADLDIEFLKKEWCEAYFKKSGHTILEDLNEESASTSSLIGGADDSVV